MGSKHVNKADRETFSINFPALEPLLELWRPRDHVEHAAKEALRLKIEYRTKHAWFLQCNLSYHRKECDRLYSEVRKIKGDSNDD